MATSYRPEEHGSRDDRPKSMQTGTEPGPGMSSDADTAKNEKFARDADTARDPGTTRELDAGTKIEGDPPTRVEHPRDEGVTPRTTSGTAVTPAPAVSADDAEATKPIMRPTTQKSVDHEAQLQDEALEARRRNAVQLGIARTRNRGTTDFGLLVLRLMNVVLFLHGLAKATGYSGFRQTVANHSFGALAPDLFAILVVAGQLALPVAIALGIFTRLAGLLQAVMMGFIWVLFPLASGLLEEAGEIAGEAAYLSIAIGLTLFFTGAGRMSIDQVIFATGAERRAARRAEKKLT